MPPVNIGMKTGIKDRLELTLGDLLLHKPVEIENSVHFFLRFDMFIWSFQVYLSKNKEKTYKTLSPHTAWTLAL